MTCSVAFVGAGPTTIYTLHSLLTERPAPFELSLFEKQPSVGRGTPYRPGWNDPAMLSNIASIEIPPLAATMVEWLHGQSDERLARLHIGREDIDERTFYPRLVLGEYFSDQMQALLEDAALQGIVVTVRTRCEVKDAVSGPEGMILRVRPENGELFEARFDHVVLATGHQWPEHPEVRPGYFASPWPASEIEKIPATRVGIRGSSLTAIDAAVALAVAHGDFVETEDGDIAYMPGPDTGAFHMTMLSRKGLLPEADFYFPIPYEPLTVCTKEAIELLITSQDPSLLDHTFELFKHELAEADPAYAEQTGLASLGLEDFCEGYFSQRLTSDPFVWARDNLAEAERNYENHHVVAWRYAILRMHEVVEGIVPHLSDEEFGRFSRYLKTVFVDDYATVPHESIQRMLALHRAGKLDVIAVGEDYTIDTHSPRDGAILKQGTLETHFPVFIEATGQRALAAKDFPFPSLRDQGIVRDVSAAAEGAPTRGIAIDDQFHLVSAEVPIDQLFCLSLPFIMGRHPFVQGITSSYELGQIVAHELAAAIDRHCAPNDTAGELTIR
ncbi:MULTISPECIES: FAD/NAD(P)-binding protein [unclassified Novosphingobium]|uniref:FAD/NAD(P)-binding protein n=1 Tax=unclassified Novosphingobium TaxID=2644732 RepID=UPI00135C945C|nr:MULTISPECIES: FAD/NAD(P)-binding protein [unclassified Novosphingobium]